VHCLLPVAFLVTVPSFTLQTVIIELSLRVRLAIRDSSLTEAQRARSEWKPLERCMHNQRTVSSAPRGPIHSSTVFRRSPTNSSLPGKAGRERIDTGLGDALNCFDRSHNVAPAVGTTPDSVWFWRRLTLMPVGVAKQSIERRSGAGYARRAYGGFWANPSQAA
jgi:hypothetical protein